MTARPGRGDPVPEMPMSLKGGARQPFPDVAVAPAASLRPPPAPPAEVVVVDARLPQVPPFALGQLGAELAALAAEARALLGHARDTPVTARLQRLTGHIGRRAVQMQRVARLLVGDYLPVRETIELDEALRAQIAELARAHPDWTVTLDLRPAPLWLETAAVGLVLELALDWAVSRGRRLRVRLALAGDPPRALLSLEVGDLYTPVTDDEAHDALWLLCRLVAQGLLLEPQRLIAADSATLLLHFPPQSRQADDGAVQVQETVNPALPADAPAAGCHVVVVEPDTAQRLLMRQLLHEAGMRVEVFASAREAEDLTRHFVAEALVCGLPPDDPARPGLLAVLRGRNPALRVVQLTDEDFLYIGLDGAREAARVGRGALREVLVQAVLLSVGVFAPPTLAAAGSRAAGCYSGSSV